MNLTIQETFLRILIVFICSSVFGIWRHKSRKPVGFGTFIFVSIGSCSLAIAALNLTTELVNPLPLLSAIVTGIGFLGAGALIRTGDKIFGFTTASTIWIFAIFGLIIGIGQYLIEIIVYIIVITVSLYDSNLEKKGIGSYQKKIILVSQKIIKEKDIKEILVMYTAKFKLIFLDVDKKNSKISFTYLVEGTKEQINKIPQKLFEKDWFESCKIE